MMTHETYQKRLEYVLEQIQAGRLQSPHDLAIQFDCTEKTVRNMINTLRSKGHHIRYSKSMGRYVLGG